MLLLVCIMCFVTIMLNVVEGDCQDSSKLINK